MCFAIGENFFIKQNLVENLLCGTRDSAKWNSAYIMILLVEQFMSGHGKGRS